MATPSRHARIPLVLLAPVLLAGCAMPVPVTIASFFVDGLSMATTNKTVTDHGLSFVAQKDCAVWRGLTEGEVCRDADGGGEVLLALADETEVDGEDLGMETAAGGGETATALPATPADVETAPLPPLGDTRQGLPRTAAWEAPAPSPSAESAAPQVLPPLPPQAPEVPDTFDPGSETVIEPAETEETRAAREPLETPAETPATAVPAPPATAPARTTAPWRGGFHYVIVSFARTGYAERLIGNNPRLGARVAEARVGAKTYYRVVVGPLAPPERKSTRRRLVRAAFADTWGVRIADAGPAVEVAEAR